MTPSGRKRRKAAATPRRPGRASGRAPERRRGSGPPDTPGGNDGLAHHPDGGRSTGRPAHASRKRAAEETSRVTFEYSSGSSRPSSPNGRGTSPSAKVMIEPAVAPAGSSLCDPRRSFDDSPPAHDQPLGPRAAAWSCALSSTGSGDRLPWMDRRAALVRRAASWSRTFGESASASRPDRSIAASIQASGTAHRGQPAGRNER